MNRAMVENSTSDGVTVIRMAHGKANALDLELIEELIRSFRGAAEASHPVILTGSQSIFSAGVDLFRVLEGGRKYVEAFLPRLTELLRVILDLEVPVIGAINGHAIAGGFILAQCCDHRLMSTGRGRIGVPELLVGVPFPALALEVLRSRIPQASFASLILTGETFEAGRASELGLVDELVAESDLLDRARDRAAALGSIPRATFALTRRNLWSATLERFDSRGEEIDREVLEIWTSPSSAETIRAYLERTIRKK